MPDRFLAFRMFGSFAWPPLPGLLQDKNTRTGAVEIFFVRRPAKPTAFSACLRWTPLGNFRRASNDESALDWAEVKELYPQDNIYELSTAELKAKVGKGFESFFLEISSKSMKKGRKLHFMGGDFFEQFATPENSDDNRGASPDDHRLTVRVPLISRGAEGEPLTGVVIGQPDNPGIRIELALPTPLPLGAIGGTGGDSGVFGFAAVYSARERQTSGEYLAIRKEDLPSKGSPLVFDTLVAGPPGSDVKADSKGGVVIGSTLFSAVSTGAEHYRYKADAKPGWEGLWLGAAMSSEKEALLGRLFAQLGLVASNETCRRFTMDRSFNASQDVFPDSVGLWTDAAPSQGTVPSFRVLNRFTLRATGTQEPRAGDTVRVKGGELGLRLGGAGDGWHRLGKRVSIMADLHGQVDQVLTYDDSGAVTGIAGPPLVHLTTRIGWAATVGEMPGLVDIVERFQEAVDGARIVESAQPAATLPVVELPSTPRTRLLSLRAVKRDLHAIKGGGAVFNSRTKLATEVGDYSGSLLPGLVAPVKDGEPGLGKYAGEALTLSMEFPLFIRPEAGTLKTLIDVVPDPDIERERFDSSRLIFTVALRAREPKPALASLGGLAFEGVELASEEMIDPGKAYSRLRAYRPIAPGDAADLDLELRFDAKSILPVGLDIPRGERRVSPIMFDENPRYRKDGADWDQPRPITLKTKETLSAKNDRVFTVELRERTETDRPIGGFVLISDEPFAIKRAVAEPLDSRGGDEGTVVARYSSLDRAWLALTTQNAYRYLLPPQAIGESMDKPRRLEIQDDNGGGEWSSPLPEPEGEDDDYSELVADNVKRGLWRRAVEFRLTPPAELWVRPADVSRRLVLPEWAAGDLFMQRGELGLGVRLAALTAEFVYGLSVAVDPSGEIGPSRRARVTEVGALLGRPVDSRRAAQNGTGSGETLGGRWSALGAAYATRPERLEVWADDPDSTVPFAPARFSDGASFVLRHSALHRHPVIDAEPVVEEGTGAMLPPPVVQGEPNGPRFQPHGLSGGALWPIESSNVLAMIVRKPLASGGAIEKVALSPLGGDADQAARFANNRAAILTETRGGYVQRQKVEVIGRIGVLWHRARHVIVYERTVNPSAQFAPEKGSKHRTRRPILRKIQEYVEILQPERRYPDIEGAQPHTNAFLAGVRFNSRIIPVDSSWAEEVGDAGFMVPLWNRYAARVRPQVYRRPDVAFILHAEGAGEKPDAPQECLNPENLFFFADTSPGLTDDTDLWPQRLGIDATNLPPPQHGWMLDDTTSANDEPAGMTPRGFGRFTWRLAPPTARATINAGRGDTPVYAALETVTFARSVGKVAPASDEEKKLEEKLKAAVKLKPEWPKGQPPAIGGVWDYGAPIKPDLDKNDVNLVALSESLAKVAAVLPRDFESAKQNETDIRNRLDDLKCLLTSGDTKKNIESLLGDRAQNVRDILKANPSITPNELLKPCGNIAGDFKARIDARKLVLRQELRAWEADTDRRLVGAGDNAGTILASFGSEKDLKDFLQKEIEHLLEAALAGTTVEVGKLQRGIETARATVADVDAAVAQSLDRLRTDLLATRRAIQDGKPWSLDRIERFRGQIGIAFEKGQERLQGLISDAQRRLATELDGMSQSVAGVTSHALSLIVGLTKEIDFADNAFREQREKLEKLQQDYERAIGSENFRDKLAKLKERIDQAAAKPGYEGIAAKARTLLGQLEKAANVDVRKTFAGVIAGLITFEMEIGKAARGALKTVSVAVATGKSQIEGVLRELNTLADEEGDTLKAELIEATEELKGEVTKFTDKALAPLLSAVGETGRWSDAIIAEGFAKADEMSAQIREMTDAAFRQIDEAAGHALGQVEAALNAMKPDVLSASIVAGLLELPAIVAAIRAAREGVSAAGATEEAQIAAVRRQLSDLVERIDEQLDNLGSTVGGIVDELKGACDALSKDIAEAIESLKAPLQHAVEKVERLFADNLGPAFDSAEKYKELYDAYRSADADFRRVGNELAGSLKRMEAWGDRALNAIGDIGKGGLSSAPNNVLKALAAIGSGPELPNLDFPRDRLGYYYGLVNDVVDTTPMEAWFGRLGDSLKAMGITLPFKQIGDRIIPDDLRNFDIGRIIGNFAGIDLSRFFRGIKMPSDVGEAIRLTHDFDKKTFRAWAQIDIKVHKPGRNSLFAIGPFTLDMVDARLTGFLRLEASKDTDRVEEAGEASIVTDLAAVVGGQTMVTLKQVKLSYAKTGGLEVDFDPKNVQINPTLKFIENTLKNLSPDEVGGMEVVKNNGIPVGLRHAFALPPLSLTFGTSGVQNIQISNQFELLAYPDFVIANRFALARPETPFIFTVFIIGGTGWLTVDMEYRPFEKDSGLLVVVEAGAGGAASLAFAFAGVTGSVFITISVALTYRKQIGKSGGGLTVSLVVVITGLVDVLRIASALITVMLRLSYQDNGDIDATGSFRITIRISHFFKISARGQARYRMKGGKKETSSSNSVDYEVTDKKLKKAQKLLKNA